VDDDDGVRGLVVEVLEMMGFVPILRASDGEHGYELFNDCVSELRLIVSDWEMPKLSGLDLLKKIRAHPEHSDFPFVMITSQSSVERFKVHEAISADVDSYLMKPFTVADLKAKVNKALENWEKEREIKQTLEAAEEAMESSHWSEAEVFFRQVLAVNPKHVEAHLGLARIQLEDAPKQGFDEALRLIRAAIQLNPAKDSGYIELAMAFENAMSLEKAIACLKDAINECPMSERIRYHLGRLLLRRGKTQEGVEELKRAVEINPNYTDALELLAQKKE
jgi:two-component system, chemotaxis family, chemotaxis protein CheY